MKGTCLIIMHIVAFISNIALNIAICAMFANKTIIGKPWYDLPADAGIVAIVYCIKTAMMMLFFFLRFHFFSKSDWK